MKLSFLGISPAFVKASTYALLGYGGQVGETNAPQSRKPGRRRVFGDKVELLVAS